MLGGRVNGEGKARRVASDPTAGPMAIDVARVSYFFVATS